MKYIVTSDIHLGHIRTPTNHIINSFKKSILTEANSDAGVMFISGDLFDRLLDLNSSDVMEIVDFFNTLLDYCISNNMLLRVLEGTPGHDWQQSELLYKLNEIRTHKCNMKYFKALDVEYIPEIARWVLYIPDEWTNTHEDLEKQIESKFLANKIHKVDIGILHGQFKYQLPIENYKGFYFKEEYFLNVVRGYIHVGHYHKYSRLDRILANGSLDRLVHGEEDPKGYVVVNDDSYIFIENTNAYIYKTINVNMNTSESTIDKKIYELPKDSYVRIVMSKDNPYNLTFDRLKIKYSDYNLSKKLKDNTSDESEVTYIANNFDLTDEGGYVIERDIYTTLKETITNKHVLSSIELSKIMSYIAPLEVSQNE